MGESESYVSSSHTVAELKVMCKENGLSVAGRKAELIERLNRFFMGDDEPEEVISLEEEEVISSHRQHIDDVVELTKEVLFRRFKPF